MTSENPPPSFPNDPPPENQPPGHQNFPPPQPGSQPGYPQPGYQQPGYQQPGYQQPGFQGYPPQQPPNEPATGYQNYQETLQPGYQGSPPQPSHSNRGKLIASVAAVVVLAGGGTATYLALSSSERSGASSPTAAVQNVVTDLQQSDLLGVLDDLAPGERDALANAARSDIDSLKNLGVLSPDASGSSISGVSVRTSGITYGRAVPINDHVEVVPITGGSVDVSVDAAKLPFTQQILSTMTGGQHRFSRHAQIPRGVRIATEKVDGRWYTSLFYTIADSAAHHRIPTPADEIPARGAATPEDAVLSFVRAAMRRDYRGVIELISPDELGALHDYGGMLGRNISVVPPMSSGSIALKSLQLSRQDISGGVRLTPSKIVLSKGGRNLTISRGGNCVTISAGGQTKRYCAADIIDKIAAAIPRVTCSVSPFPGGCSGSGHNLKPAQKTALTHLVNGLLSLGVDTAESNGKWYVTPIRTYADISSTVLGSLQGHDLFALASLSF
jgi:hypothetical protein